MLDVIILTRILDVHVTVHYIVRVYNMLDVIIWTRILDVL